MRSHLDIFLLVPGMPFDGATIQTRCLGGSESAALYMAKSLSKLGARVKVFCNAGESSTGTDGVQYLPIAEWSNFSRNVPHDVCIAQRAHDAFSQRTSARLNLLWCHDLALGRQQKAFQAALWNIDRVIVLSEYMKKQYEDVFAVNSDLLFVSRNGIDTAAFRHLDGSQRDRRKLVFAARPERGLDVLLRHIMPRLLAEDPEFQLHIAGYGNDQPEWRPFYAQCDLLSAALGDRVVRLGGLRKEDLYRLYASAAAYLYPTPSPALPMFREVSCISAMECQAAGLPIVSTKVGALEETIAQGAGRLLDIEPGDPAYVDRFVQEVLDLSRNDRAWQAASSAGREHAVHLDWTSVAKTWLQEFEAWIRAANDSPERLLSFFWRMSDIVPAKEMLRGLARAEGNKLSAPARARIDSQLEPWSFIEKPDGYRLQYEAIGAQNSDYSYDAEQELRFSCLAEWLEERKSKIRSILDYGCAHGAYALGLVRRLDHLEIHGVDIDRASVEKARRAAIKFGVDARAKFSVWVHDAPEPLPGPAEFDCVLAQEVLEHVPEPWAVLEALERRVSVGGKVYLTVPFGPWEFLSYRTHQHRCHIWHFDAHDLRDMIGSKKDCDIRPLYGGDTPTTGEPLGWWIASYTVDHGPVRPIDLARHVSWQRPRQSLSAALIAGPGAEETLHWTLRSIQDVADELIIADCGMSSEALRIANQYGARVVKGVDPRLQGFDAARNIALDHCSCDWCLWIDADERLVGPENLEKYLRPNSFQAYAVRQHHFACDDAMPVDYPLRLFRRAPRGGRQLRFWGSIHEHPEFEINSGAGPTIALPDVHIAHLGYLNEKVRRERFLRNWPLLQLDQRKYPDRLLQKFFVMRDNMHLVRYTLGANGGVVDEAIQARCRETIAFFREFFLGKTGSVNRNALEYYSEALTVLDEGFDTSLQLDADKHNARSTGSRRYRFASTEDLCVELRRQAEEKTSLLDSPTW